VSVQRIADPRFCETAAAWKIHEGHFGDVRLDGLNCGFVIQFPGAVHEGNGTIQLVVEDKADARQREALVKIMSGEETEDMATMWWVFSAMSPNKLAPLFLPIDFEVDVEARRARLNIPGLMEATGKPIRKPVTGPSIAPGSTCRTGLSTALRRSTAARPKPPAPSSWI